MIVREGVTKDDAGLLIPVEYGSTDARVQMSDGRTLSESLGDYLKTDGEGGNLKPDFAQAASRINIYAGQKLSTILGYIKKYFADLKAVAFSGAYADLTGKPTATDVGAIPAAQKGAPGGVATLDSTGRIVEAQATPQWRLLDWQEWVGRRTFTVPDGIRQLFVIVIGAGGSGAAGAVCRTGYPNYTRTEYADAMGGAAGIMRQGLIPVVAGQTFQCEVGAGGAAVSTPAVTNSSPFRGGADGVAGGASSFGSIVAEGGEGGGVILQADNDVFFPQATDGARGGVGSCSIAAIACRDGYPPMSGSEPRSGTVYGNSVRWSGVSQQLAEHINRLAHVHDIGWLYAGATGYARAKFYATDDRTATAHITPQRDVPGLSVGAAGVNVASVEATAATKPGCGGSAAVIAAGYNGGVGSVMATSGRGADGAIYIYGTEEAPEEKVDGPIMGGDIPFTPLEP